MGSADRWIDRFLQRVRLGELLRRVADFGAMFLFAFGTIVLVVKLLLPQLWPHVLLLAIAAVPVAVFSWWQVRRVWCRKRESIAMLDQRLGTGGLLMTLCERPDPGWADNLPALEQHWREAMPKLRPKRLARFLLLPMLFAVGVCFVPLREGGTTEMLRNTVARHATEELEELLSSLEETSVLEDEEKTQLREEIQRLAEETKRSPLTHEKWETVDALRERMQVRLQMREVTAAKAEEAAAKLAQALQPGSELSREQLEQLQKTLGEALQKFSAGGEFPGASSSTRKTLRRLLKNGKLTLSTDPVTRREQLENLREYLQSEHKKLSDLRKQHGECEACKNGTCPGGAQCQNGGSGQQPGQSGNGAKKEGQGSSSRDGDGPPGRGGINRGRGDAPLTWGQESDEQESKFKQVVLPPGSGDQPKDEVVDIQANAPNEDAAATAPRTTGRAAAASAGNTPSKRRLSPKHRKAVQRFFQQK